jgi:RimJ/RimL family protein N-acetyltransferase
MIRLEPFDRSGYAQLMQWVDTEEDLMQFAGPGLSFPLTEGQLDVYLKDPKRHSFKVVDIASGKVIGHAAIRLTDRSGCLCSLLIGDPQLRGKGTGKLLVDLLLNHTFNNLGQTRAELNVFDWNTVAIRCYEKAGFVVNPGVTRERKINGKTWTAINMVLEKESRATTWLLAEKT